MKALVLCAGYGTRLGNLTRDLPKPMLPIAGKPLLAYNLDYLACYGFTEIALNLHYRPETIRNAFGDGKTFGVTLTYSYEETLLGTAGAVKKLEPFFSDVSDFLVLYGDLLIDQALTPVLEFHRSRRASATLLLHQRRGSNSMVRMDDQQRITDFIERPSEAVRTTISYPWVNSGLQILSRRLLAHIPTGQAIDLPAIYMATLKDEPLYGFPLTGNRYAIDSPERYAQAEMFVQQRPLRFPHSEQLRR